MELEMNRQHDIYEANLYNQQEKMEHMDKQKNIGAINNNSYNPQFQNYQNTMQSPMPYQGVPVGDYPQQTHNLQS